MSVTAVPIQPLKKGSLTKYWAAIALVLAAGGGLAYWGTSDVRQEFGDVVTTPSGLRYKIIEAGEGPNPTDNDVVLVSYKGMLKDGTIFDQNPQAGFPVTGVVPGFSEGLKIMQRGGKYRLWIPAALGYGPEDQRNPQTGEVVIPGGSELTFDVELLEFKSRAEIEAMQKQMQEMQQQQQGSAGDAAEGLPPEIQAQIDAQMRGQ
ncbi:FKBP-type peptidyl-prolyl cis-trans isomerase [Sphingorhabdus wooponensis]|uniref:Peptidyl-prolyl cis-trans isomerase n=1 Tax=Sphingorhabdus wooponensis TaxID=940136 RepID=A0A3R8Q6Z7_9SPHN|nr:FKBP-type peptidyl-prolyl cis-trans isomerase [Sphingorhabdus wooponensis]RRQ51055.1 FKBP-type peptidyl-prolyl cis-trans isomerase [Sphingorhabdus wooponensis]